MCILVPAAAGSRRWPKPSLNSSYLWVYILLQLVIFVISFLLPPTSVDFPPFTTRKRRQRELYRYFNALVFSYTSDRTVCIQLFSRKDYPSLTPLLLPPATFIPTLLIIYSVQIYITRIIVCVHSRVGDVYYICFSITLTGIWGDPLSVRTTQVFSFPNHFLRCVHP